MYFMLQKTSESMNNIGIFCMRCELTVNSTIDQQRPKQKKDRTHALQVGNFDLVKNIHQRVIDKISRANVRQTIQFFLYLNCYINVIVRIFCGNVNHKLVFSVDLVCFFYSLACICAHRSQSILYSIGFYVHHFF